MVFYIYLKTFFVESKNGHAIRQAGCTSGILLLILNIVYIFKNENLFLNHNYLSSAGCTSGRFSIDCLHFQICI